MDWRIWGLWTSLILLDHMSRSDQQGKLKYSPSSLDHLIPDKFADPEVLNFDPFKIT